MLGLVLCAAQLSAQTTPQIDADAAIESAGKSLRNEANFPWYDAETDSLRNVAVRPETPPPEVKNWSAPTTTGKRRTFRRWNFSWSTFFARLMQYLAWGLLAALFLVGLYYGVRALMESEMSLADDASFQEEERTDAERIENLPIDVRSPNANFLDEAQRHYRAGNYAEAIIYLFSYQLMQLDKYHWIRLAKGKTNRQYLREIHRRSERAAMGDLREVSHNTMVTFEDSFFGHHVIGRERFERCWKRLDDFHRWVQMSGATS